MSMLIGFGMALAFSAIAGLAALVIVMTLEGK